MAGLTDTLKGRTIFGIDLGTTNSGVAVWDEAAGGPVMLKDAAGRPLLPSLVAWDAAARDWRVGHDAEAVRRDSPAQVAYSVKRFIGRRFDEAAVRAGRAELSYALTAGDPNDPLRAVAVDFGSDGGKRLALSAPDVSAKVLAQLRATAATAAAARGLPLDAVRDAVIAVPAYFNNNQRQATRLAGQLAGWEVADLIDEPTAAALAYGGAVLGPQEKFVLVCDLGGGTFDVSLLRARRGPAGYVFHTRVVDGDTRLGGDDIDAGTARWLAGEFERQTGRPLPADDPATRDRLRHAAEEAKVALSARDEVTVDLPGDGARAVLSRARLEACAGRVLGAVRDIVRRAVEDVAGLAWDRIDEVVLVGGQTLMPAVRRELEALTGRRPFADDRPQLAVALGAAAYGRILSLGRERFHENSLINVLALALGIRLEDNTFEQLVPANVTVPYVSRPFLVTTTEDNQTFIRVQVLQGPGRARKADECEVLGSIDMEVPPAPARRPRFEVRFHVRSDGTMKVEVTDTRRDRREVLDIVEGRVLAWREDAADKPA
jgi:molecular chaperone DnaK